jgi:hypothetical protein
VEGFGGKACSMCVLLFYLFIVYLAEGHRLEAPENRVLRRIFGPKRDAQYEAGENCITRSQIYL